MDDELSCAKLLDIMELGKREKISVGLRNATSFRNLKDSTLYKTVHKKVIIEVSMVHWKITCTNNPGGSSAAEKKLLQTRIGRRMTSVMLKNRERVQSGSATFSRKCRSIAQVDCRTVYIDKCTDHQTCCILHMRGCLQNTNGFVKGKVKKFLETSEKFKKKDWDKCKLITEKL